jgi:putative oxidoreductase
MLIGKLLSVKQNPRLIDLVLLTLRVLLGATLFLNHGREKLTNFSEMAHLFQMDPLHIGVYPTLAYAAFADGICSLLVILGLATRAATFFIVVNLSVVFFVMEHGLSFSAWHSVLGPGMQGPPPGHAELVLVYLAGFVALLIAGAGNLSVDRRLSWGGRD